MSFSFDTVEITTFSPDVSQFWWFNLHSLWVAPLIVFVVAYIVAAVIYRVHGYSGLFDPDAFGIAVVCAVLALVATVVCLFIAYAQTTGSARFQKAAITFQEALKEQHLEILEDPTPRGSFSVGSTRSGEYTLWDGTETLQCEAYQIGTTTRLTREGVTGESARYVVECPNTKQQQGAHS